MTETNTFLETERLFIRNWTLDDVEAAYAMYSDPEVARFIRDAPEESLESQRATLEVVLKKYDEMGGGFGFWAIVEREAGEIVGSVILKPLPGHDMIEVGWHLARSAWGKGYATEAARAVLDYGFNGLGLARIVAVVNPLNERSLAVARRLGMHYEGQVQAYKMDLELFVLDRPLIAE